MLDILREDMNDSAQRENGRHKADHYRSVRAQWMMPQYQIKDNHSMKIMAIMAERDSAIQERNIALAEKKTALAERDMAIIQRDAAVGERNAAIMERDNALTALEYARENSINGNNGSGYTAPQGTKHFHQQQQPQPQQHLPVLPQPPPQLTDALYIHAREMHVAEAHPISAASDAAVKGRKAKRPREEAKSLAVNASNKTTKAPRKGKRNSSGEDLNKLVTIAMPLRKWRRNAIGGGEDLNKQAIVTKQHEWKVQDLGLSLVVFDETTMPPPGCSCTGLLHQCYKWGNGGWQSACCTTTMSMYPLPVMPNKRHARVAGRKMSGSAFAKLLSRLATEGHDLSAPLDLRDHWARHGTNRYITIK